MMNLYACMGSGNCMKPWLALKQLGVDFELTLIDVLKGEQTSDAYLAVNPFGVGPFLITEQGQGLGESNAMLWYICDGTYLMPDDPFERADALRWMFFEQSKLEPFISPARFFLHIVPEQKDARAIDIANWQSSALPGLISLNDHLADRQFLLRSGYNVADSAIFGYVHVLEEAGLDSAMFPHVMRWIDDVRSTRNFVELCKLGHLTANAA